MSNLHAILFCIYRLFPFERTVKTRKKAFSPKDYSAIAKVRKSRKLIVLADLSEQVA